MTNEEFDAWTAHTDRSRHGWQFDRLSSGTLMYHGGASGTYVMVEGSTVSVGAYEGAIPHIGEALFRPKAKRRFGDRAEALAAVAGARSVRALVERLNPV